MKENFLFAFEACIKGGLIFSVFILPLVFSPFFSPGGIFEFTKQIVLYFLVGFLLLSWAFKMFLEGRIEISKSRLDALVLLFVFLYAVATIFSLDRATSVFGFHPHLHGGFLSILSYAIFYFVLVSNVKEKSYVIKLFAALFASSFLVVLGGFLGYFKVAVGPISFSHPFFQPVGSWDAVAYWIVPLLPPAFGLLFFFS